MKKVFLLMFAILASIVPGWADKVTDLSQLDNDKVYVLRSERAFLLYSDKLPAQLCSSTGKVIGSVTASLTDPTQQFRIEKNGDNYYLFSVGAQKYVSSNGNYEANASKDHRFHPPRYGQALSPHRSCTIPSSYQASWTSHESYVGIY